MTLHNGENAMTTPAARKPIMTLYSGTSDPYSHRTRIVLYEKDIECQIVEVDINKKPRELGELNPYNQVPTMVDRDLVLYESNIINEYLDERLPHPPLMPVDPVSRAKARLMLMRFDRDWYSLVPQLGAGDKKSSRQAKPILDYAERIFQRKSFKLSLTDAEKSMR